MEADAEGAELPGERFIMWRAKKLKDKWVKISNISLAEHIFEKTFTVYNQNNKTDTLIIFMSE